MATKRPIATISFNSVDFVRNVCNDLIKQDRVQSWAFISHKAEEDTKKDHIHLLLIPSSPVDPVKIRKCFLEFNSNGDLSCLPFLPSKVSDWLLYALHFPSYLLKKGLVRVFNYNLEDVYTSESREWLDHIFFEAQEELLDSRLSQFLKLVARGDTFGQILSTGLVPPNQVLFYDKLYRTCPRNLYDSQF